MDAKHIERDYSAHKKSVKRFSGEYCGLEIFSFDPKYTRYYLREDKSLKKGSNCKLVSHRRWSCYCAEKTSSDMILKINYNALDGGDYRIDLVYEQSKALYTSKDLTGDVIITKNGSTVYEDNRVLFDGEDNIIKRIPIFLKLKKGKHTIEVDVPPNIYFYGIVVRKIVKYTCNNYFGADMGKDSGNMMFTDATYTLSDMTKPSELTLTVLYDDAYECDESPSGFYIDYMDEVNFYVKDNNGKVERVFGGYVSSVLPNANRTELSIHCADRLVDGQNKYVLDELTLQGGKDATKKKLSKDFKSYTQILKYICDVHEVTLKSNISPNYLVEGEKYNGGFTITYGKNKTIKKIPVTNGYSTVSNNHITIRNKPSSNKKQVWTLYDASKVSKTAPNITNKPYIHITYGMGSPVTTHKTKITETVDNTETSVGVQKFSKCGVSQDKKYVMGIGLPSAGNKDPKKGWTKAVFQNKCPHCGKATLVWGIFYAGNEHDNWGRFPCTGRWEGGSAEGHIFCANCDADYSVQGHEHTSGGKTLKVVSSPVKSSKKEAYQLKNGEMKAVPKTGESVNSEDIFKAITKEAFKYKYSLSGNGQSYSQMKKSGHGDCWGFSDLIFTMMKKFGVGCKIVEYRTEYSDVHRSVLYKNSKGNWVDFPYREYKWNKKYNNMLNNTGGSKTGRRVNIFKGARMGSTTVTTKNTKSKSTTEITTTKNYDASKPFQGYLKFTYSINSNSFDAPKHKFYLRFTQRYTKGESYNDKGFPLYWVNNNTKKVTFLDKNDNSLNIVEWLRQIHNKPNQKFYLQSIHMIAPVVKVTTENKDVDWYKYDKTTHDESSCKMDLYQITFDNNQGSNPDELSSCGKSVNSMLEEIVKDTGYYVNMQYGYHRKDDRIHFRVNNSSNISFTASEGNDNNILSWNSISYSPVSSLYNNSVVIFKIDESTLNDYYYVDTSDPKSIFGYGEQTTLITSNEPISKKEAYFNARMSDKYNPSQTYSFTITVPNYPSLRIGDYVKVIANAKKLNSVKQVKSIKVSFNMSKMPRIQTEIGLDELAPDIQLKQNIRNLRRNAKKETTSFSSSATPVNDVDLYEWDR